MKKVVEYLTKLCYILSNRREDRDLVHRRGRSMKKNGIFDAKDLACYIKQKYNEYTKGLKEITPIKMQKALYFCFAYWAGFVNKGKINNELLVDENMLLFGNKIEAWAYGPVVPSVYFNEKTAMLFRTKSQEQEAIARVNVEMNNNSFLKETIDSILQDVFEVSDFKLVSISHMDKSWQNHFHNDQKKHSEEIPKEEIINEYTAKKFD